MNDLDPILLEVPILCEGVIFSKEDDKVIIREIQDKWLQKFVRKLGLYIPEYKNTSLDDYGSHVVNLIDGKRDILTIGQQLQKDHKEAGDNLYERLIPFLEHLRSRDWITYKDTTIK